MRKKDIGEQGEALVVRTLSGLKAYHHLLNNVTLINKKSGMSHQLDHVLIHPHGIFVIETKNYYGGFIYESSKQAWYKIVNNQPVRIASPLSQNKSHVISLYRALKGKYEIIPVVVFSQNNAPYMHDDNLINLKDLLLFIDSYPYKKIYTNEELDEIKRDIDKVNEEISLDEHLDRIKNLKEEKGLAKEYLEYIHETGLCPICHSRIIERHSSYFCTKCDFKIRP